MRGIRQVLLTEQPSSGWYNIATGAPSIVLTCNDDIVSGVSGSGCKQINWDYDGDAIPGLGAYSSLVTISAVADGEHSFVWRATDNAGNVEDQNEPNEIKVDTVSPTITITDDESGVLSMANNDVIFTFTFSEAVTGFTIDDIDITGGTKELFTGVDGDTVYTLLITADADSTTNITVDVSSDVAIDIAGNGNDVATQAIQEVDTLAPIISVAGVITLSNDVSGDGIASIGDEITYTAGTDSTGDTTTTWTVDLSDYGLSATAIPGTYTIVVDNDDGPFSAEETATDGVGNSVSGDVSLSGFTDIDNIAPVVTDENISIEGGLIVEGIRVYRSGDILKIVWDSSISGDNNSDIEEVRVSVTGTDLLDEPIKSELAGADELMTDTITCGGKANDKIYEYCYTIPTIPGFEMTGFYAVVTAYDDARNSGERTDSTASRLDTLAPDAPSILSIAGDDQINNAEQTTVHVVGTAEKKSTVSVTLNDGTTTVGPETGLADATTGAYDIVINVSSLIDGTVTATVNTTDQAGNTGSDTIKTAVKDTVAPTVASITTKDTDFNGRIDTVTLVFDEPILDSTLNPSDFTLNSAATADGKNTGTPDDETVDITLSGEISGTEAKVVKYTPGTVTDIVGNPLAWFNDLSTDEAGPVMMSAITISTTEIKAMFSENLNGTTVTKADFTVDGIVPLSASETSDSIVIITINTPFGTGDTPTIVSGIGITDIPSAGSNPAPQAYTRVAIDGVAPILSNVSISSTNVSPVSTLFWVKTGEVATLTFTSSEGIATPTVMIDGQSATTVSEVSANNWKATYIFTGSETEGVVPFTIDFEDVAIPTHNIGITVDSVTDASEVLYDRTIPTVDAGTDKEVNTISPQDATISDAIYPNGSGLNTWEWTKVSGPGNLLFIPTLGNDPSLNPDTVISADTDGVYEVKLTVTDHSGNVNSDTMTFIWDTTAPVIMAFVPANSSTGVAIDSGIAKVVFYDAGNIALLNGSLITLVNNGTDASYKTAVAVEDGDGNSKTVNISYSLLENDITYRINVFPGAVRDVAGNELVTNVISNFTTSEVLDTTAPNNPVITTSSDTVDSNSYTINGTVADDGGQRVVNLYNGSVSAGVAVLSAGETSWSILATLTQDASNVFTAKATDEVGNVSGASNSVTITEATPADIIPTITLSGNSIVSNYTVTEAGVRFNSGLQFNTTNTLTMTVNGADVTPASLVTIANSAEATTLGLHVYNVIVTSSTGNTANITVAYNVNADPIADETAPVITLLGNNPQTLVVGSSYIELGATASDNVDGDVSGNIDIDSSSVDMNMAGTYNVTYNVSDTAGNNATEENRTVIVEEVFDDTASLAVTGVDAIETYATADDTFENGWSWKFKVTVPTDETQFKMKFADFIGGGNSITSANNVRFYTTQSSDSFDSATATMITAVDTYSGTINLNADLESGVAGRQIEVIVEMKVPVGSAGGSYSASYGVKSETP